MPELLPCPLCGSTNLFLRDMAGWELDCRDCELSLVLANDYSREGVINRWNTRTPSDAAVRAAAEEIADYLANNTVKIYGSVDKFEAIIHSHLARTGEPVERK